MQCIILIGDQKSNPFIAPDPSEKEQFEAWKKQWEKDEQKLLELVLNGDNFETSAKKLKRTEANCQEYWCQVMRHKYPDVYSRIHTPWTRHDDQVIVDLVRKMEDFDFISGCLCRRLERVKARWQSVLKKQNPDVEYIFKVIQNHSSCPQRRRGHRKGEAPAHSGGTRERK